MATRFVNINRDTPLLLPADLHEWVPADPLAHFVIDAVEAIDLRQVKLNTRGTGDAQYPPTMLLGLLVYSYATGTEWTLVCLAYNLRRLHRLGAGTKMATAR